MRRILRNTEMGWRVPSPGKLASPYGTVYREFKPMFGGGESKQKEAMLETTNNSGKFLGSYAAGSRTRLSQVRITRVVHT